MNATPYTLQEPANANVVPVTVWVAVAVTAVGGSAASSPQIIRTGEAGVPAKEIEELKAKLDIATEAKSDYNRK